MAGEEILIADGVARDRQGLVALAERLQLVPSAVDRAALARERMAGKFFAVAVIDLDLPGGALELLEWAREHSPATQLVALTGKKNYDGAVHAFRLGCVDVVFKRPEESSRLEQAIENALARYYGTEGQGLRSVIDVLDGLVKTILALGRELYAEEIQSVTQAAKTSLRVLFVDDDTRFLREISEKVADLEMDAFVEMSAGAALDKIGTHHFDAVVVKQGLSDLPGQLVVSGAQKTVPECIALVYDAPGPQGRIEKIVEGRTVATHSPFLGSADVAERVRQLVEEEQTRRRERKVLQVVGSKHGEILRRYAEARRMLQGLVK